MRLGIRLRSRDLGLQAGILTLRLGFEPFGRDFGLEAGNWDSKMG